MGLLALGIGVGLGVAAYRHMPGMTQRQFGIVVMVVGVGMVASYFAGRRRVQSQWQFQIQQQQQLQDQEQTQQQAVVVNVLDRDKVVDVAGGVPALAGDPATPTGLLQRTDLHELAQGLVSGVVERGDPVEGALTVGDQPKRSVDAGLLDVADRAQTVKADRDDS
jgi:hypothetical protein